MVTFYWDSVHAVSGFQYVQNASVVGDPDITRVTYSDLPDSLASEEGACCSKNPFTALSLHVGLSASFSLKSQDCSTLSQQFGRHMVICSSI